ncbi:MAG: YggS family pyridoxal phosphate-dependent enzyme [Chloroflexota bacterium]|nr:YggS family pyridoxal phosphate-dependent enzyme [Chloroflexota bacterium]
MIEQIRERADEITARLRAAAERAGRDPDGFRIVAVTKGFDTDVARAALSAGLTRLGENRVQEALPKVAALPHAEWHLIGRLQRNKAHKALAAFAVIHSVDSIELLRRLDDDATRAGLASTLLLEVNVSGEPTKAGFAPERLDEVAPALSDRVVGLMTMARHDADEAEQRRTFATLRMLRDRLQESSGIGLLELSMGMSGDAEAAVAEGATLVRIGTALFGLRPG